MIIDLELDQIMFISEIVLVMGFTIFKILQILI